jgi:hypothetical protein
MTASSSGARFWIVSGLPTTRPESLDPLRTDEQPNTCCPTYKHRRHGAGALALLETRGLTSELKRPALVEQANPASGYLFFVRAVDNQLLHLHGGELRILGK